jgi:DNA-binding transcriptional LysR family regulator
VLLDPSRQIASMASHFPFDFDLLRSFVAVAENRGFTRAAARVGRTQSTVSLQIKKLEENLGRPLFERGSRELQLTSDGEMLIVFARQILKLADEARASMMEADVEGSVRLGTPEDFATVYLPNVLAQFARTHPRIGLEVNCNFSANLLEGFSKGEYDLVLIKREPVGPVGGIAVWRDVLVWVGSPGFRLDPGQPVPLVLATAPDVYRKRALTALESVKIPWRMVFTSPSSEGLLAAVRAGLGVTVLSKDMVPEGFLLMDTHHGLPILPDAEIALYHAPGKASRASQLLSDVIINALEISPTRRT